MTRSRGFTVIELLIAMAIVLSIAGALARVVEPARAVFERVPAELDLQQRGRTAIDAIARALRAAGADAAATAGLGTFAEIVPAVSLDDPDESGERFAALTVMAPVASGAQGTLESDQAGASAPLALAATTCPDVRDVCGFSPGMTAVIADGAGHHDVFIVAGTTIGSRTLTADRAFSYQYPAGSAIVEIERHRFSLAAQGDGGFALSRETAAGAAQPVADSIAALWFTAAADAVGVTLTVRPAAGPMRRVIADRVFSTSVKWRQRP